MKITWYGTASISLETATQRILFDPFLSLPGSENKTREEDFTGFDAIFITHGHVDHLASIPKIMKHEGSVVYCTETPAKTLKRKRVNSEWIHEITVGDRIDLEDVAITVLSGKHVRFDHRLIAKTLTSPRILRYGYNLPYIAVQNRICRENNEIVSYLVEVEGKQILVLGSLGVDMYPCGVDLLILPYQGTSELLFQGMQIVARVNPQIVMLDHFDDAFPPISRHTDTKLFEEHMKHTFSKTRVIVPEAKVPIKFVTGKENLFA